MELSKKDLALVELYNKGYRISKSGDIINPGQKVIKGNVKKVKDISYRSLNLRKGNSYITVTIHRLQAYQKFGDKIFTKGIQVRHLNNNSSDNTFDNIGIGTNSDNSLDKLEEVRIKSATIASRKMQDNLRTYEERCKIYDDIIKGLTYKQIKFKHNVNHSSTLSYMKNKSKEFAEYKSQLEN